MKIRRSTGNVFRDLGFSEEEATNLKMRTDLMIRLSTLIETRGLTQAQAAEFFGVSQPRISDLVRGTNSFDIDYPKGGAVRIRTKSAAGSAANSKPSAKTAS